MKLQTRELYRSFIRSRMREHLCEHCGHAYDAAEFTWAGDGSTFEDLGLSEGSDVAALAATEHLLVRCATCGANGQIGVAILRLPTPLGASPQKPWGRGALDLYRSLVVARLRETDCPGCGLSLEDATVVRATGGDPFGEHGLSDDAFARFLASTQVLAVQCARCGHECEV